MCAASLCIRLTMGGAVEVNMRADVFIQAACLLLIQSNRPYPLHQTHTHTHTGWHVWIFNVDKVSQMNVYMFQKSSPSVTRVHNILSWLGGTSQASSAVSTYSYHLISVLYSDFLLHIQLTWPNYFYVYWFLFVVLSSLVIIIYLVCWKRFKGFNLV